MTGKGPAAGYEVGYGKPPKQSQFKQGQSANPSGRPKGAKGQSSIQKVLDRKVSIKVDGKRARVPITEAAMVRLVENAFKGDDKALREVIRIAQQVESARTKATPPVDPDQPPPRQISFMGHDTKLGIELGILVGEPYDPYGDSPDSPRYADWVVTAALARMDPETIAERGLWRYAGAAEDPSLLPRTEDVWWDEEESKGG